VPASPWLDSTPPDKPKLFATVEKSGVRVHWETDKEPGWLWVLQFRANGIWTTQILPANQTSRLLENSMPDAVSIRAVDRVGNLSASMVLSPQKFQKLEPARSGKIRPDLNWPPRK
jgi:hypothetical protein